VKKYKIKLPEYKCDWFLTGVKRAQCAKIARYHYFDPPGVGHLDHGRGVHVQGCSKLIHRCSEHKRRGLENLKKQLTVQECVIIEVMAS
jgi:hypothetical protein